jgi:hypothetical protein
MLKPEFKEAVKAEIRRCRESGQSEAVALADWLDGIYEEEDMTPDLVCEGLFELVEWSKSLYSNLLQANMPVAVPKKQKECDCSCHDLTVPAGCGNCECNP